MNNSSQLALLLVLLFCMPTQASQAGATNHNTSAPPPRGPARAAPRTLIPKRRRAEKPA